MRSGEDETEILSSNTAILWVLNSLPTLQAAGRWSLASKGEYLAAGVGSAITGYRADLGIIDDPVKSREDADSKIMRDRAWEWFKSDFRTRLKPSGSTILI